jgi:hypothetical protein
MALLFLAFRSIDYRKVAQIRLRPVFSKQFKGYAIGWDSSQMSCELFLN